MLIGIDWGGTKIEGIAMSTQGEELLRLREDTPRGEYDGCIRVIVDIVARLERETVEAGSLGIGIRVLSNRVPAGQGRQLHLAPWSTGGEGSARCAWASHPRRERRRLSGGLRGPRRGWRRLQRGLRRHPRERHRRRGGGRWPCSPRAEQQCRGSGVTARCPCRGSARCPGVPATAARSVAWKRGAPAGRSRQPRRPAQRRRTEGRGESCSACARAIVSRVCCGAITSIVSRAASRSSSTHSTRTSSSSAVASPTSRNSTLSFRAPCGTTRSRRYSRRPSARHCTATRVACAAQPGSGRSRSHGCLG